VAPSASTPCPLCLAAAKPVSRHVILFLAANPSGTARLALDEECAAIERELSMAPWRDHFDFRSRWAVSVDEMMRCLNQLQPTIIHLSGHGSGGAGPLGPEQILGNRTQRGWEAPRALGTLRDVEIDTLPDVESDKDTGIYLQDGNQVQHVTGRALTKMIAAAAPSARVVVLNACFSDAAAESLRQEVDCVISMNGAVGDDAARSFAAGFYRALGNCRSVGNAVKQAVATLAAKRLPDAHLPVCRTRDGVSADQLFLRPGDLHLP
jgi:CHAT domain-containing protein